MKHGIYSNVLILLVVAQATVVSPAATTARNKFLTTKSTQLASGPPLINAALAGMTVSEEGIEFQARKVLTGRMLPSEDQSQTRHLCYAAERYYRTLYATTKLTCKSRAFGFVDLNHPHKITLLYTLRIAIDELTASGIDDYAGGYVEGTTLIGPNLDIVEEECGRFLTNNLKLVSDKNVAYTVIVGLLNENEGGQLVPGYVGVCKK